MKNKITKITLSAIALSALLLQGCAGEILRVTGEDIARTIISDVGADKIRTWFSDDDFGLIDDGLVGKKSIYVSFNMDHDNQGLANIMGEARSKQICDSFKEDTQTLKIQYDCYVVANKDSDKQGTKINYANPKADGILLKVEPYTSGGLANEGLFTGSTYQITYTDLLTNKVDVSTSPEFFKISQVVKYSTEYLTRLAQQANESKL
ncbi:hypothetical protein CRYPA_1747 [uncultured Candidatus Thioglobus sp.]|nr:hypothetical protein CRYPA_1747 [uncultured Candidatus Thioglobus sp.]